MDKKPEKLVPEVRFKGFTDDWEQRKLGEISKRVRNNDGRMNLPLLTISARYGWMTQQSRFSASIAGREKKNYTLLEKHQLSYNHGNSKVAIYGTVYELTNYDEALVPKVYHSFSLTPENSSKFIESYFHTKKLDAQLRKFIASTARMDGLLNISFDDFMKVKLFAPEQCEQSKISRIINLIEKLITLQQRKLALLKQLKKGFLQKMFADKDSKRPILRVEGFNNEWECKKLGDIARMYQPKTITSSKLASTGYPVFGANGYIGFYSEANHMDDQVTISARGEGTGTPSYVKGPVWITGNSMVINVDNSGIDKAFLFNNLSAHSLKKYVTGGAQPQLTREVLKGISIMLSGQNEQTKIGDLSKRLIKIISFQQNKLSKLKDVKKALLQQMFI